MRALLAILGIVGLTGWLSGCESANPQDLLGNWKIDRFWVDGMERDRVAFNRNGLHDPVDWGTGIAFTSEGLFRTNRGQQGQWRLSQSRSHVLLYTDREKNPQRWRASVGDQFLVLETSTQKIILSRSDRLPDPPRPPAPNLRANLPGTWYFYRWTDRADTLLYPATEQQARWLTLDWKGSYQSGEGKYRSFGGAWELRQDTLLLREQERSLIQTWQIQLSGDTLRIEPAENTGHWFQAQLIKKGS